MVFTAVIRGLYKYPQLSIQKLYVSNVGSNNYDTPCRWPALIRYEAVYVKVVGFWMVLEA